MYPPALDLTFRFGEAKRNPSLPELDRALHEVLNEATLGLPEGTLTEHPSTCLTYGFENGSAWTVLGVDVYRGGQVCFSRYADQDDSDPTYEYWRHGLSIEDCLKVWHLLAQGEEQPLLAIFAPAQSSPR